VPIRYESPAFFDTFAQGGVHQGIAARLCPFPFASLQSILAKGADFLLILDEILDPRNLGALLRTAEAVGVGGVILPADRSAPLSPLVEKNSGWSNSLPFDMPSGKPGARPDCSPGSRLLAGWS